MIENHFAMEDATTSTVVLTIHVFDPSQKVIVRNCHGVSVDIHGKTMMSLSVEDCSDLNLVFNSAAHACNIVHCKNVAAETTGVCPKFSMDRVNGIARKICPPFCWGKGQEPCVKYCLASLHDGIHSYQMLR
jgi:hypothetical protein